MEARQIGDYRLEKTLGSGTMGDVHAATNVTSGKTVAVKLLHGGPGVDEATQKRFVRECSILSKLQHENIVQYYEAGIDSDELYYVMELVSCGSLKEVLDKRYQLPWREVVECGLQICSALQYAHDHDIVHRDLKPANLFLSEDGHIKLGDFGIAHDAGSSALTADGQTVGTCTYMAPEQIRGDKDISGKADLYAMGTVLFQMLTGQPPYTGETVVVVLEGHLESPPPRLRDYLPSCPYELEELIVRLLAKSPEDRPENTEEVRTSLQAILQGSEAVQLATADTAAGGDEVEESPNLTDRLLGEAVVEGPQVSWKILAVVAASVVAAVVAMSLMTNS